MTINRGGDDDAYVRQRFVVDVVAVVLLIAGLGGLVVVAFRYDSRLGVAALSALSAVVGVVLGYERR